MFYVPEQKIESFTHLPISFGRLMLNLKEIEDLPVQKLPK